MSALLEVEQVTLRYQTSEAIITSTEGVSFQVNPGDRFVLLGPSGCGKSTLLKAVGGYLTPSTGSISVMCPLIEAYGVEKAKAEAQAKRALEKVDLTRAMHAYPHTLSGGMKQRVAIARGMAMEPDILLMDEPFAALDALTRRTCQDELLQLWNETKFTVLFVTHSIPEAIKIGNRILLLSPHPGRVKAEIIDVDRVRAEDGSAARLEKAIHDLLFAEHGSKERAA